MKWLGKINVATARRIPPTDFDGTLYAKNPIIPSADTITLSYNRNTREILGLLQKTLENPRIHAPRRLAGHEQGYAKLDGSRTGDGSGRERRPLGPTGSSKDGNSITCPVFQRGDMFLGMVTVFSC